MTYALVALALVAGYLAGHADRGAREAAARDALRRARDTAERDADEGWTVVQAYAAALSLLIDGRRPTGGIHVAAARPRGADAPELYDPATRTE